MKRYNQKQLIILLSRAAVKSKEGLVQGQVPASAIT